MSNHRASSLGSRSGDPTGLSVNFPQQTVTPPAESVSLPANESFKSARGFYTSAREFYTSASQSSRTISESSGPAREFSGSARKSSGSAREFSGPAREFSGPAREFSGSAREFSGSAREFSVPASQSSRLTSQSFASPNESISSLRRSQHKSILKQVLPWVMGLGAAGAAIAAAPLVIAGVGFGAGGIAAGSLAASMMSTAATTGFGMAAVSVLQSAGAAGLAVSTQLLIGAVAGATGAGISGVILEETLTEGGEDEESDNARGNVPGEKDKRGNDWKGNSPRGVGSGRNDSNGNAHVGTSRTIRKKVDKKERDVQGKIRKDVHQRDRVEERPTPNKMNQGVNCSGRNDPERNKNREVYSRWKGLDETRPGGKGSRGNDLGGNYAEANRSVENVREGGLTDNQRWRYTRGRHIRSGGDIRENDPELKISMKIRSETNADVGDYGSGASNADSAASEIDLRASFGVDYICEDDSNDLFDVSWSDVDEDLSGSDMSLSLLTEDEHR